MGWLAIGANLTLVQGEGEGPYFAVDEAYPQAFSESIDDLALCHIARVADERSIRSTKRVSLDQMLQWHL